MRQNFRMVREVDYEYDSWAEQSRRAAAADDEVAPDIISGESLRGEVIVGLAFASAPLGNMRVDRAIEDGAEEPRDSIKQAVEANQPKRMHSIQVQKVENQRLDVPIEDASQDHESADNGDGEDAEGINGEPDDQEEDDGQHHDDASNDDDAEEVDAQPPNAVPPIAEIAQPEVEN